LIFWNVGNEGHEAGTAEEFGDEDSGVALSLGGFDPLQTRAQHTGLAASLSKNAAPVATHAYFLLLLQNEIYEPRVCECVFMFQLTFT